MKLNFEEIKKNPEINAYIECADEMMSVIGITEHSYFHAMKVSECAGNILKMLNYDEYLINIARIAGYMHDIGNAVNRVDHAHSGAILARQILKDMNADFSDISIIMSAIGNHDEKTGTAVSPVSAALILADKTDVRRNRVRKTTKESFDIHDRVNYAAIESTLSIFEEKRIIHLNIKLDENICSVLDYFEIFMERMLMCRRASEFLKCNFKLTANNNKVL